MTNIENKSQVTEQCINSQMSELSSLLSYEWFDFDIQNARVSYTVYYIDFTLLFALLR